MGFLKNISGLFVLLLMIGCSKPLIIENALINQNGHFMYGEIPERNFYIPEEIGDSVKLKWTAETTGSYSNSSVLINYDYVFVHDLSGKLTCLNINTGKEEGNESHKGAVYAAPVIYRTRIFYLLNEYKENYSVLFYYDFNTGKVINTLEIPGECSNEMIKTDKGIFILSNNGVLYKINYLGREEWKVDTETYTESSPAMHNDMILFVNIKGEIFAVNSERGKVIYKKKITDKIEGGISIHNDRIFFGDSKGTVFCLKLNDGSILWKTKTGAEIKNFVVTDGSRVISGNLAGFVMSLDYESGRINWKINTGGVINSTPLLFKDYLVQPDLNEKIHFIDVKSGVIPKSLIFEHRVKLTPVFFENTFFFGVDKGQIFAYEVFKEN